MFKTYKTFLNLNLPLIGDLDVEIYEKNLAGFSVRQLSNFIRENLFIPTDSPGFKTVFTVKNQILMNKLLENLSSNRKLSRNINIKDNILNITYNNGISGKYFIEEGLLKAEFNLKIFNKRKSWLKVLKNEYSFYHIRFYNMVLFPIFAFYGLLDGYYLLHGSGINTNQENIIITGIDGVGKSSLCNMFFKAGCNILSDNFTLFNGQNTIAFNMPMRLENNEDTNLEILYRHNNFKEAIPRYTNSEELKVNKIYLLTVSDKFTKKKLDMPDTNLCIKQISEGASEINEANKFLNGLYFINTISNGNKTILNSICLPEIFLLEIPTGKIHMGYEGIINDD